GAIYSNIVSEKLEKIFIPSIITSIPCYSIQPSSPIVVVITRNDTLESQLAEFILYYEFSHFKTLVVDDMSYSKYIEFYFWLHGINNVVLDPRIRLEFCSKIENYLKQPNVEFYLNYETENPLFWFDYETGEYVQRHYQGTYVPTREGYTFAGWYKEPECINDWNFDIDKMPKYETEESITANISESDIPTGEEASNFFKELYNSIITKENDRERVRLYAKWTKTP
ncbi:MAG: InlB B-repeat-containing protein, partial [Clostridia bacterium]